MNDNQNTLSKLLQSKSKNAKLLGFGIALFLFVPSVCRIAGDESLTIWQRLEQLSIAAAQTLFTVGVAALPPEIVTGSNPNPAESER